MKRTPAEKLSILHELMNIPVVTDAFDSKGKPILDEFGNQVSLPVFDRDGKQVTTSLITKEEALNILDATETGSEPESK